VKIDSQRPAVDLPRERRVLLVAYFFPPREASGSLRAAHLARYLPRYGWSVTVLTAKFTDGQGPPGIDVAQTDYTDVVERFKQAFRVPTGRSVHELAGVPAPVFGTRPTFTQGLLMSLHWCIAFPDAYIGWTGHACRAIERILTERHYDAVITTSFPYTAHTIGARVLANRSEAWVADLRDAWGDNHYIRPHLFRWLSKHAERRALRRADAITTVSAPLVHALRTNHPGKDVFEIRNGFDPEEWESIPFVRPEKFTIIYAGSLLDGRRDPRPLLDAVQVLCANGTLPRSKVSIDFYGRPEAWLRQEIADRNLQDIVTIHGEVPRRLVLARERASSVNLLLLWDHPDEAAVYTGKLFEYLGARRPVLAVGGPESSVVHDLLRKLDCWRARTQPEICRALQALYSDYEQGRDRVLTPEQVAPYSALHTAQQMAEVLNAVTAKRQSEADRRTLAS
jgi:glycosyltransferase involved in cell wall biosynthesis